MMKNIIILLASVLLFSACSTKKEIKPVPVKNISFESYFHTLGYKQNDVKHFTKQLPYDDCSKAYRQDLKALDRYAEANCKFHKHSSTSFTFYLPLISQIAFQSFHFLPSIF